MLYFKRCLSLIKMFFVDYITVLQIFYLLYDKQIPTTKLHMLGEHKYQECLDQWLLL